MAKIDKIQVGTTSYDINLPTTATPSITSLTVTGNLTVSGTSNLSVVSCLEFICNGKEYIFPSTSTKLQAQIPADSYAFTVSTLAMNTSMSYSSTGKIWSLEIDSMGGYRFAWLYGWYSDRMLDFGPIYLFRPRSNSITSYRRHGRVISDGTYLYYTEMFVSLSNNLTNSITVGVFKKTLNATSWTACTNSDISLYVARSTEISV